MHVLNETTKCSPDLSMCLDAGRTSCNMACITTLSEWGTADSGWNFVSAQWVCSILHRWCWNSAACQVCVLEVVGVWWHAVSELVASLANSFWRMCSMMPHKQWQVSLQARPLVADSLLCSSSILLQQHLIALFMRCQGIVDNDLALLSGKLPQVNDFLLLLLFACVGFAIFHRLGQQSLLHQRKASTRQRLLLLNLEQTATSWSQLRC